MPDRRLVPPALLVVVHGPAIGRDLAFVNEHKPLPRPADLIKPLDHQVPGPRYARGAVQRINDCVRQDLAPDSRGAFEDIDVLAVFVEDPVLEVLAQLLGGAGDLPLRADPGRLARPREESAGVDDPVVVLLGVHQPRKGQLLDVAQAYGPLALLFGPMKGRQQDRHENRYDSNDHEKLDERESSTDLDERAFHHTPQSSISASKMQASSLA